MNRRFVNLLVNKLSGRRSTFSLHRIDRASLFSPTTSSKLADPAQIKKAAASDLTPARLPPAAVSFNPRNGWMDFMARNDDIIAVDQESRTLRYDGQVGALRVMSPILNPRPTSISLTVDDDLYVLARELGLARQVHHFQVLSLKDSLWYPLEPLPFYNQDIIEDLSYNKYKLGLDQLDPFEIGAYTAISDSEIWISTVGVGTYSFNTDTCSWSKIGDWALPFCGSAHYVPEYGLWFGFSDEHLCAADLQQQPPGLPLLKFPLLEVLEESPLSEAWTLTATSLFPLGSGKICIARIFGRTNGEKLQPSDYMHQIVESFAVLAGVEVVKHAVTGSLHIIKHKAMCYSAGPGKNIVKPL
uniref:Uncharacterized protein n=6 Tax=Avena sativa TaxID=4498 RepID=A0ACD5V7G2_AVESA